MRARKLWAIKLPTVERPLVIFDILMIQKYFKIKHLFYWSNISMTCKRLESCYPEEQNTILPMQNSWIQNNFFSKLQKSGNSYVNIHWTQAWNNCSEPFHWMIFGAGFEINIHNLCRTRFWAYTTIKTKYRKRLDENQVGWNQA